MFQMGKQHALFQKCLDATSSEENIAWVHYVPRTTPHFQPEIIITRFVTWMPVNKKSNLDM